MSRSKRQSPLVGRIDMECESCLSARMTVTESEAHESPPACPVCREPMTPVRAKLVRRTGKKR